MKSTSNNIFSMENMLNHFQRLPATTEEKFEFFKSIRQLKKLLLNQQTNLLHLQDNIEQITSKITKNHDRRQFHQAKFEDWYTQKQHRLNEVTKKINDLQEVTLNIDNINPFSISILNEALTKLKIKNQELKRKDDELTNLLTLLEREKSYYEAELIRLTQLEKDNEEQKQNLLSTLQQQLENNQQLNYYNLELFESEKNRIQNFITSMKEDFIQKKNTLHSIKETFTSNITKISDQIQQITISKKNKNDIQELDLEENELNKQIQFEKLQLEKLNQYRDSQNTMQRLVNEQKKIQGEISHHLNQNEKFTQELTAEHEILKNTLNALEKNKILLQKETNQINQLLEKKISFASGQYIDDNDVMKDLENRFKRIIPDKNLRMNVIKALLNHCQWRKITNLYNYKEISDILINFYDTYIKVNWLNAEDYAQLFDKFLAEKAIGVENDICIKDVEEARVKDSLARFLYTYIRHILHKEPGPVIALTEWEKEIKIAFNESEQNSESEVNEKYQLIKSGIAILIELINKCPSGDIEEQKKYILNSIKVPADTPNSFRFYADMQNILQYQYNEMEFNSNPMSFLEKLNNVSEKDVLVHTEKKLYSKDSLHAEVLLLKFIVCEHIRDSVKNNQPLSLFPENHSILIGLSKLNCSNCFVTINSLKKLENKEILTTGAHFLRFDKNSKIHLSTLKNFFESVKFELMNDPNKIPNRVIEFIDEKLALINAYIKNKFGEYHFIESMKFENTRKTVRKHSTISNQSTQYSARSPFNGGHLFSKYKKNKENKEKMIHPSTQLIDAKRENEVKDHHTIYNLSVPGELQDFAKTGDHPQSNKDHIQGHTQLTKRSFEQDISSKKRTRNTEQGEIKFKLGSKEKTSEGDEVNVKVIDYKIKDNSPVKNYFRSYMFTNSSENLINLKDFEETNQTFINRKK